MCEGGELVPAYTKFRFVTVPVVTVVVVASCKALKSYFGKSR